METLHSSRGCRSGSCVSLDPGAPTLSRLVHSRDYGPVTDGPQETLSRTRAGQGPGAVLRPTAPASHLSPPSGLAALTWAPPGLSPPWGQVHTLLPLRSRSSGEGPTVGLWEPDPYVITSRYRCYMLTPAPPIPHPEEEGSVLTRDTARLLRAPRPALWGPTYGRSGQLGRQTGPGAAGRADGTVVPRGPVLQASPLSLEHGPPRLRTPPSPHTGWDAGMHAAWEAGLP